MTPHRLRELLVYNPCTGEFRWRVTRLKAKAGKIAGCFKEGGYRVIKIEGKLYRASRLAWLYSYGEWPEVIDHIDRNPSNDSLWNLANGTQLDNMKNYHLFRPEGRNRSIYPKTYRSPLWRKQRTLTATESRPPDLSRS